MISNLINKRPVQIICSLALLCFLVFIVTGLTNEKLRIFGILKAESHESEQTLAQACSTDPKSSVWEERNAISKLLNEKLEIIGQMQCEKTGGESAVGGWCNNKDLVQAHVQDKPLSKKIAEELQGKTMASFGDGSGIYKKLLLSHNLIKSYDSYDGNPFSSVASNGSIQFLDLSVPQYWPPIYDWIMSLEVAEHIPAQFEQNFVDNLARHALEGIILSWATIGQGGRSHVNNRNDSYVREQMLLRGFRRDEEMSKRLKNSATLQWLRANTNAYRRTQRLCL